MRNRRLCSRRCTRRERGFIDIHRLLLKKEDFLTHSSTQRCSGCHAMLSGHQAMFMLNYVAAACKKPICTLPSGHVRLPRQQRDNENIARNIEAENQREERKKASTEEERGGKRRDREEGLGSQRMKKGMSQIWTTPSSSSSAKPVEISARQTSADTTRQMRGSGGVDCGLAPGTHDTELPPHGHLTSAGQTRAGACEQRRRQRHSQPIVISEWNSDHCRVSLCGLWGALGCRVTTIHRLPPRRKGTSSLGHWKDQTGLCRSISSGDWESWMTYVRSGAQRSVRGGGLGVL